MASVRSICVRGAVGLALVAAMSLPGSAGAADVAMCGGHAATIVGTEGPDELVGTTVPDVIVGLGGDDHISGDLEEDFVCGGEGDDTIETSGSARAYGGPGNDTIVGPSMRVAFGGPGDDHLEVLDSDVVRNAELHGDEGDDTLLGGTGSDDLYPGLGRDTVDGGEPFADTFRPEADVGPISIDLLRGFAKGQGRDTVTGIEYMSGTDFDDRLAGDSRANLISSGDDPVPSHDVIIGRGAGDLLYSRGGAVLGGPGNDKIQMIFDCCSEVTDDHFDGGAGRDTIRFDTYGLDDPGVTLDLEAGTATGRYVGMDALLGFEDAEGTSGADRFLGNDADNEFTGEGDDDYLDGRDGNDTLKGRFSDDTLVGGDGNDQLDGGDATDILDGGPGTDHCNKGETVTHCE